MLNAKELNTKEDMVKSSSALSCQLVDIQNEVKELNDLKKQLIASLQIVEEKVNKCEIKKDDIANDLNNINLCKKLIYGDLNNLGNEYVTQKPLSDDVKKILMDHGCKIIENLENGECKVKRIVLGKLK